MGIEMSAEQASLFKRYHEMLFEANREMNLTRVSEDLREACDRNYLDSLTLLPYLVGAQSLIDVGSGAGFPGIPLAIMRYDMHVTLIDALGKRVAFLNGVIEALGLNAEALHLRSEDAARQPILRERFDVATARAVASMDVLSEWLLPFVRISGKMLALKGLTAEEELQNAQYAIQTLGGEIVGISDAEIPGRDWQHKIICVNKIAPTPDKYPRKAGIPQKRPLKGQVIK